MTSLLKPSIANQVRESLPRLLDVWFDGVAANMTMPPESVISRWWGKGRSADENAKFNAQCRQSFGPVLDSLKELPVKDHAAQIADELYGVESRESKQSKYNHSLALLVLLDQMPRCILGASSPLVYQHYDVLAQNVSKQVLDRGIDTWFNPDSLVWRLWFYMPLEHSEDIEQHHRLDVMLSEIVRKEGDSASGYTRYCQKAQAEHVGIVSKFGRYPYRNVVLGRKNTPEEEQWLTENGNPFATA